MKSKRNILVVFIMNLVFSIMEIIGGIFTNSVAIISDSIHDFGDAMSMAVAYFLEKKSEKRPDNDFTYGYTRYSLVGALITSSVLIIGSCFTTYNSIIRLLNPTEVNYKGMIILAIIGLIINGTGAVLTSKKEKLNEKVINLHLMEDLLGWIAVIIVSIIMSFTKIYALDAILSLVISIYILVEVVKNLGGVFNILLERKPDNVEIKEIKKAISEIEGVKSIHHIHLWCLDESHSFITFHLVINDKVKLTDTIGIKKEVRRVLRGFKIGHSTIEIELEDENCN